MRRRDNVVLIGFMGAGKSVVGGALAKEMNLDFIDLDQRIELKTGRTISDIFSRDGEAKFRELEAAELKALEKTDHAVVATGGGIVTQRENHKLLYDLGPMIWLKVSADAILKRLSVAEDRPLLAGPDRDAKVRELLRERTPLYQQVADHVIDTTDLSLDVIVRRIIKFLDAYQG